MATAASTLITRCRRQLRDYPDQDALTASVSSSATALTVADTTLYFVNEYVEVDQEVFRVKALASGTSLTVARGAKGSTAASHASASIVLLKPAFFAIELLDALNEGLDACFPRLYKPVEQEYTGTDSSTYEYTLPNMTGINVPIPYVQAVEMKESGDLAFRNARSLGWEVIRSAAPILKLRRPAPTASTLRIRGYGPFAHFSTIADTLDSFFPINAENLPVTYAVSSMLASGEASRVRQDSGALDQREQANRPGSASAAAQVYLNRFYTMLERAAMPPMPPSVKSVL